MTSGPITSWQIERDNVEVVTGLLFLGSKITVDSYCSHEIGTQLLLGRKARGRQWHPTPVLLPGISLR